MTGFGRVEESEGRGDVGREQVAPGHRPADAALGLLGQVVAGAERAPGALEDDDADVRVGLGGVQRRRPARRPARR